MARVNQTSRDMVLSLGLAFGVIALVLFLTYRPGSEQVRVVEYVPTVNAARDAGAFDVAAPVGLSDGWVSTSVRYQPSAIDPAIATWHLGFVTPDTQYVAIEQTNGTDDDFLRESTAEGSADGSVVIEGRQWQRYVSESSGHRSLVSKSDGITTVVTGTLSFDELAEFLATLRTS